MTGLRSLIETSVPRTSRRRFLSQVGEAVAATAVICLMPVKGVLAARSALPPERQLSFHCLHTDERVTAKYVRSGVHDPTALAEIDQVLRDWRTGDVTRMDREMLDLLYALRFKVGSTAPIQIISGYRSPKTNAKLADKSRAVAKRSLHMRGMAIDFRLADRSLESLHRAAMEFKAGGVGLYSRSGFLHIDTGRVRSWGA